MPLLKKSSDNGIDIHKFNGVTNSFFSKPFNLIPQILLDINRIQTIEKEFSVTSRLRIAFRFGFKDEYHLKPLKILL